VKVLYCFVVLYYFTVVSCFRMLFVYLWLVFVVK